MEQRSGQDGYCRKGSDDYADSLENENGHEKKNIPMVIMPMALMMIITTMIWIEQKSGGHA